jgi:3-methyladenine DNA glycosylase/8-oxoguanine DNA glycosylase
VRDAEYIDDDRMSTVQSLARHFVSGQLSVGWLAQAPVEEVSKALIAVRGIGQVSVILSITQSRIDNESTGFTRGDSGR